MRVMVFKVDEKGRAAVVIPNRDAHLAPILVQHADKAVYKDELSKVLAFVWGAENGPRSE